MREFIIQRIEKWQEPAPAKLVKPLAAPVDKPKKRRGGKRFLTLHSVYNFCRVRREKDRLSMTEVRKQANRMPFGGQEEQYQETGIGFGMLGVSGSGKVGKMHYLALIRVDSCCCCGEEHFKKG